MMLGCFMLESNFTSLFTLSSATTALPCAHQANVSHALHAPATDRNTFDDHQGAVAFSPNQLRSA